VSRAIIVNMLHHKGRLINGDLENVLVHWGGWSSREGIQTMKDVYLSKCLDQHLDVFGLAYDMDEGDHVWVARLEEFMGQELYPSGGAFKASVAGQWPYSMRMRAIRRLDAVRSTLDRTVQTIVECTKQLWCRFELVPVNRYQSPSELFLDACHHFSSTNCSKTHPREAALVASYRRLRQSVKDGYRRALGTEICDVWDAYLHDARMRLQYPCHRPSLRHQMLVASLLPVVPVSIEACNEWRKAALPFPPSVLLESSYKFI
jgi:hypothetical protein